ncbi:DNA primase [Acidithiobacillus thiooxidans]|uniref:DNA primase n=2 Tax=Acidithiobacillus TaxID=119977 RepID=UPI001C06DA1E|nr:CHC2 zinc finger domain-containing protein [Acidithiobacillus thiooxidans]
MRLMNFKSDLKPLIATALSRVSLAEVFHQHGIALRKQGEDYVACCPFHSEKTPSCHVYTKQNRYHCFGCHAHGDTLTFLMQHDGHPFLEAVETLADMAGVPMPERPALHAHKDEEWQESVPGVFGLRRKSSATGARQGRRSLSILRARPAFVDQPPPDPDVVAQCHVIVQEAARIYQRGLSAPVAQAYLKKRQITEASVERFALGYADGSSPVYKACVSRVSTQGEQQASLYETAGVITQKPSPSSPDVKEWADRFRNRLIFPIRDEGGSFCGMGGRYLSSPSSFGKKDVRPKYINTPETPVYHKSQMLYGLHENQSAIRSTGKAVLVEGYMDVIGLFQGGIENAVASCGTALTDAQLTLLLQFTSDILLCFDGDAPGRAAALKAAEKCLEYLQDTVTIRALFLPEGMDPYDLMQTPDGPAVFDRLAMNAVPVLDVLMQTLQSESPVLDRESADRFLEEFGYRLEKVPGEATRDAWRGSAEALVAKYRPDLSRSTPLMPGLGNTKATAAVTVARPSVSRPPDRKTKALSESFMERAVWWLFRLPWETAAPIWSALPVAYLVYDERESPATKQLAMVLRSLCTPIHTSSRASEETLDMRCFQTSGARAILEKVDRQVDFVQVFNTMSAENQKMELAAIVQKITEQAQRRRLAFIAGIAERDGFGALTDEEQTFLRRGGVQIEKIAGMDTIGDGEEVRRMEI